MTTQLYAYKRLDHLARGSIGVSFSQEDGTWRPIIVTNTQWALLKSLVSGSRFVSGAKVHVARKLAKCGLVTLEDNGPLGRINDGERWLVVITQLGREFQQAMGV